MKNVWMVCAVIGVCTAVVFGYCMDEVVIQSESGVGDSTALLIVDFWPGNSMGDSFAFAAKFNGQTTGMGLLDIVAQGDSNFSYSESGGFLADIWYTDPESSAQYHTTYDWPDSWWSYWISDDYGQTWGWSGSGAATTVVGDGDTNGWLALPGSDYESTPITPIPEPTVLLLLGLGCLGLRKRS